MACVSRALRDTIRAVSTFWRDRPTLITGATGLIGGWLVPRLLSLGADVICLVRDTVPTSLLSRPDIAGRVRVVRGDVRDQALLERALGEYEVATVFHLAAQTIVGIARRNAVSTFDTNVGGTCALLEACRRSPLVAQIVVASSDKAYGEADRLPYDEQTPLRAVHPYDASKACQDIIALSYAATWNLPVVVTRCGNFFGGGDLNWSRIVPGSIRSIVRGEAPVIRSDGTLIRDYFYVEDGAVAYTTIAEALASDPSLRGQAFNFSNEKPVSVLEITQAILNTMGSNLKPIVRGENSGEISAQYLDASKARRVLGWSPKFDLSRSLTQTVSWYRYYLHGLASGGQVT